MTGLYLKIKLQYYTVNLFGK